MSPPGGLDLADIQGGVLHQLPSPYTGMLSVVRIDDPRAGRDLLARLLPAVRSAENPASPEADAWISVALSFSGLRALGLPENSLDSFPREFREGMAARAARLHDVAESAPENWEPPFGTSDVYMALTVIAPDSDRFGKLVRRAGELADQLPGVQMIYRLDCRSSDGREAFGYRDNISHPAIEGGAIPGSNPGEPPLAAGEFILGYPDETGQTPPMPAPIALGRNGSFLVLRKLHQRAGAFRAYLHANAPAQPDEELLAAKIMGRWRSGAPLVLARGRDDAELGADPARNNDFGFKSGDDARGLKCPAGSHIRRMNPRDADIFGNPRRHRLLRREAAYGPPLAEGALNEDGADREIIFACVGASLLPSFVVTRGGEYFFLPGLNALRWLAQPEGWPGALDRTPA